jgi:hypothetical protein
MGRKRTLRPHHQTRARLVERKPEPGQAILPGAAAITADYEAYLKVAPDIIAELRLDPHDDMPTGTTCMS